MVRDSWNSDCFAGFIQASLTFSNFHNGGFRRLGLALRSQFLQESPHFRNHRHTAGVTIFRYSKKNFSPREIAIRPCLTWAASFFRKPPKARKRTKSAAR